MTRYFSMNEPVDDLVAFISQHDGINDKSSLSALVQKQFALTKDRSVFYNAHFAIRFSSSAGQNFGNTVLSLSNLQKVDDRPFVVCLVTPTKNHVYLANTTFLKKISHSSEQLRVDNIRGSFNGSDIMRDFNGIPNAGANFSRLSKIHAGLRFDDNLVRLVAETNNISPTGQKFRPTDEQIDTILGGPSRAARFVCSMHAKELAADLDAKVARYQNEILMAALIENVNVRGRVIEYLIAGRDESLRREIVDCLRNRHSTIPPFKTHNGLGDYRRDFPEFLTETDVKTKIMILDSNPKAYNLDKMLEFLAVDRSVFLFYFVGIEPGKIVNTLLVSMFQTQLLSATILLRHWAGRNSRGVSQFEGRTIQELIETQDFRVDEVGGVKFLQSVLAL